MKWYLPSVDDIDKNFEFVRIPAVFKSKVFQNSRLFYVKYLIIVHRFTLVEGFVGYDWAYRSAEGL
jgi:hypothetical protein